MRETESMKAPNLCKTALTSEPLHKKRMDGIQLTSVWLVCCLCVCVCVVFLLVFICAHLLLFLLFCFVSWPVCFYAFSFLCSYDFLISRCTALCSSCGFAKKGFNNNVDDDDDHDDGDDGYDFLFSLWSSILEKQKHVAEWTK